MEALIRHPEWQNIALENRLSNEVNLAAKREKRLRLLLTLVLSINLAVVLGVITLLGMLIQH